MTCPNCQKDFLKLRKKQEFCSTKCNLDYRWKNDRGHYWPGRETKKETQYFHWGNFKEGIIVIALLCISFVSYSQDFMGVKPDGTKSQFIAAFKEKGFTLSKNETDYVVMAGKLGTTNVEVFGLFTPISNTCWKIAVFLPSHVSWYSIKSEYEEYSNMLTEKYGPATKKYSFFMSPYEDGDGYEMTALAVDKCRYLSFWEKENIVTIKMASTKQVAISYENKANADLDDKETKQVNQKSF